MQTAPSTSGFKSGQVPALRIQLVSETATMDVVRQLFRQYQDDIGIDLGFQDFERELLELPGEYAAPHGALLLAYLGDDAVGCCALRPLPDCDYANACEMKRLYVQQAYRGLGLGRMLVDHTLTLAQQAGYDVMLLDTLNDMETARALYEQAGFEEVEPYYHNPLAGAHYLKVEL